MYKQCVSSVIVWFWCQWIIYVTTCDQNADVANKSSIVNLVWLYVTIFKINAYSYTSYRRLHLNQTSNAQLWHFELVEACSLNLMINVDKLCCNLVYFVYWNFDINLCQRTNGKFSLKIQHELQLGRWKYLME